MITVPIPQLYGLRHKLTGQRANSKLFTKPVALYTWIMNSNKFYVVAICLGMRKSVAWPIFKPGTLHIRRYFVWKRQNRYAIIIKLHFYTLNSDIKRSFITQIFRHSEMQIKHWADVWKSLCHCILIFNAPWLKIQSNVERELTYSR